MTDTREQQWTVQLQKARQRRTVRVSGSLEIENARNIEAIKHYKEVLREAIATQDDSHAVQTVKRLTTLRARQVTYEIEQMKELYGTLEREEIDGVVRRYYQDCHRLARHVARAFT